jgi:hypothetical protein
MAITLKEESILNEWSTIVEKGAEQVVFVLSAIQERLREANMPGNCTWSIEEVQSSGFFAKVRRELIVVRLEEFKDYRVYIGVRAFGIHMDCSRFLTVEPNVLKKWASERLTGVGDALSAPKNILIHQDLRAWATVVHHAVIDTISESLTKLGQDPRLLNRTSKGILEIW